MIFFIFEYILLQHRSKKNPEFLLTNSNLQTSQEVTTTLKFSNNAMAQRSYLP